MLVESPEAASAAAAIPATLRDGYEVHRAALRHGLDVMLYPRQVLIASPPGGGPELAFVHGVPQTSTLAAVTYAQDKRMRRELLERAGLPVPPGATFAIGRDRKRAREFARQIGYPVVVKPAVGDNLSEVFPGIQDERQLDEAIDYLRIPESERPTFSRAAYGLTLLLEPDEEDGRTVAPSSYQFLLERHVSGQYLRILVLDQRPISAIQLGPAGTPNQVVTSEIHPSVRSLASEAAGVIPGLAVANVDLVLDDPRRPVAEQPHWIVELTERPWLATPASVSADLSHQLGEAVLRHLAAERSVPIPAPREQVELDFLAYSAADPGGLSAVMAERIREAGLGGRAEVTDPVEGTVGGTVTGPVGPVAWLFESLVAADRGAERTMLLDARQRPPAGGAGNSLPLDRGSAEPATGPQS
jgi:hypothetical protein